MRLLPIVVSLMAAVVFAEESGPKFFRPLDHTVIKAGTLDMVARASPAAQFTLDGKPLAATSPGPGAWTARVPMSPGKHEMTLKDGAVNQVVSFFVPGEGDAPAEWAAFRLHPPAATCETCHAVKQGSWAFKHDVLSESCLVCHDAKQFPVNHQHTPDVLVDCQMCHQPHGASAAKLLKLRKELACKQCHG
ncbi:MAG: cytochrome c3 family protein [Bryobacteraceae bacterium]